MFRRFLLPPLPTWAAAAFVFFPWGVTAHSQTVAVVESLPYASTFDGYRPWQPVTIPPAVDAWRDANRTVAEVGGHAGVVRAMADSGAPPDALAKPAASGPAPSPTVPEGARDDSSVHHHDHGGH